MNIFNDYLSTDLTFDAQKQYAARLLKEYWGLTISSNGANLINVVPVNLRPKLINYQLDINLIRTLIDTENTAYIYSPTYSFTQNEDTYKEIYEQLCWTTRMQSIERTASICSVLVQPQMADDKTIVLRPITLADESLKFTTGPTGVLTSISYDVNEGAKKYTYTWDSEKMQKYDGMSPVGEPLMHMYGKIPFAILNYGHFDGYPLCLNKGAVELYQLLKIRSTALSNAYGKAVIAEADQMLILGATPDEVKRAIMSNKTMALDAKIVEGTDQVVVPQIVFNKQEYKDALGALEMYLAMFKHIKENRGHIESPFSNTKSHASAEAIRMGSMSLGQQQQEKRKYLSQFETDFFNLVKWTYKVNQGIDLGGEIVVNYKPDPLVFSNAADEITYFRGAIQDNILTPVHWQLNINPELSWNEALDQIKENIKTNKGLRDVVQSMVAPIQPASGSLLNENNKL